jgi:hypothetical protein
VIIFVTLEARVFTSKNMPNNQLFYTDSFDLEFSLDEQKYVNLN